MNATTLWIVLPIVIGAICFLVRSERAVAFAGGLSCFVLACIALLVPIDTAMRIGPLSLKIASSATLLGRSLVLPAAEAPLLVLLFGFTGLWFLGAEADATAGRLVPVGMIIVGLLIASLAVQPFLFAALLIEVAVLAAIPLLAGSREPAGRGAIRFLIYQTLGMPFILFAGWMLAGVETSPGDLSLTVQSTIMLALGFAFLLAIFPLNDWIPKLMEEGHPYISGFVLWLLPNIIIVFLMSFLDRYAWLRSSPEIGEGLRALGLITLVSSGVWSTFERHLGRMMAHAASAETGLVLLAIGLSLGHGSTTAFLLLIARGVHMAVWAFALSALQTSGAPLDFSSVQGLARSHPWACAGVVLAALSTAGFPLLAGFPPRVELWLGLGNISTTEAVWILVGLAGLMIGAVRQLTVLTVSGDENPWIAKETLAQRGLLGAGMLALLVLGLVPHAPDFIVGRLPLMFEHLGR